MSGMAVDGTFRAPRSGPDAMEKARETSAASDCYERGTQGIEFERLPASLRTADLCDENGSAGCWRTRVARLFDILTTRANEALATRRSSAS